MSQQPTRSATTPKLSQPIKQIRQDPASYKSLNVSGTGTKIDVTSNLDLDLGSYGGFVTSRQPHMTLEARLQQKKLKDELISDSEIEFLIREKLRREQYAVECLFRNADPSRCGRVHRNALLRILYSICGHIRFEQFHRLLDRLGLDDKQTVSFADFKASFAAPASSVPLLDQPPTLVSEWEAASGTSATTGPLIGRYSSKPVSVAHAFTMLRQRAAQAAFDPREILPPACFEPGGVVLKPQLRRALALLRIPLAATDVDKFWDRFDLQGTGAVSTSQLLTLLGLNGAKPMLRSLTAPVRKSTVPPNSEPVAPIDKAAEKATVEEVAQSAEVAGTRKCVPPVTPEPQQSVGDFKYLKRYELLRKNRPKFDHFLDDLHYRLDEPYNALLVTFRHFDSAQSGCMPTRAMRQALLEFGFPTSSETEFDQFLIRFGLRTNGGSVDHGAANYSDLLGRLQARGCNSLLSRYLMSDKSPLISTDPLCPALRSDNLSPFQMELQLLRFLHRDYLQMYCGFLREDPEKCGLVSQEAFRSVLARVLRIQEIPSDQLEDSINRLPRSRNGSGVQYKPFLEQFQQAPNTWTKQPPSQRPIHSAPASLEKQAGEQQPPADSRSSCQQQQQEEPEAKQHSRSDPVNQPASKARSLVEVSQLAQAALSVHFHQVDKLYKQMDRRNTGRMSRNQFWGLLNSLGLQLSEAEIAALWDTLDTSADGQWSYRQMLRHFMTNLHERAIERARAGRSWVRSDTTDPNVLKFRQLRLEAATKQQPQLAAPQTAKEPSDTSPEVATTRRSIADLIERCRPTIVGCWDDVKGRLRQLDPQGTSCIQRTVFREFAQEFRLPLTQEEIECLAKEFEKVGSGRFNYIAFLKRFVDRSAKPPSMTEELAKTVTDKKQGNRIRVAQVMDRIREKLLFEWQSLLLAFRKFDKEKAGSLSLYELRKIVHQCGYSLSEDDLFLLLTEFDLDFDGKINYQEFVMQLLDVAEAA